jgi:hypothetical protein
LGRVREGTDLIRIGEPLRPEFAAWRYGKFFERRRKVTYVRGGITAILMIGSVVSGIPGAAAIPSLVAAGYGLLNRQNDLVRARKVIENIAQEHLGQRRFFKQSTGDVRIVPSSHEQGWALRFVLDGKTRDFEGGEARHIAHLVAPAFNFGGASSKATQRAVEEIETAGSAEKTFQRVLAYGQRQRWQYTGLFQFPEELRLAFEMAAHEESERAAIEGELGQLEIDWREAEEVASIADNLFLPQAVTEFIDRHRAKSG